jgi:RHS repeat-associated protein
MCQILCRTLCHNPGLLTDAIGYSSVQVGPRPFGYSESLEFVGPSSPSNSVSLGSLPSNFAVCVHNVPTFGLFPLPRPSLLSSVNNNYLDSHPLPVYLLANQSQFRTGTPTVPEAHMRVARPVLHLSLLFAAALILLFFGALYSPAQDISSLQNGIVPFGSYDGGDIDTVNISSGNLNIHIPLFNYPQRGSLPGQFKIVGNTKSFYVVQSCNTKLETCTLRWNMRYTGVGITQVSDELGLQTPWRSNTPNGLRVVSWDGSSHEMWGGQSVDGTGIYMNSAFPPTEFLNRNGNGLPSTSGSITQQDTNGNYFTTSGTDTLGRTIATGTFPGPNGTTTQVQITGVNVTVQTNFGASTNDMYQNLDPIQEYGPTTISMVQSIAVYDGNSWATSPTWTFQYNDRNPGDPSNINYGNVTQITLPTGGTISYTYGGFGPCDGTYLPLTPVSRGVISRTVNANDGTGPHTTTYSGGLVTDPEGNQTVHTFTALASCSFYETQTKYYQGTAATGHLLKTVQTAYAYKNNPNGVNSIDDSNTVVSVVPTTITTTLDNGLVNQVVSVWDHQTGSGYTYGELLEKQEYDYGNGAPGPLLRKTDYTYLALNNSSYLALNMLDRISSITVYNGSGTMVSQTTYGYDETSPFTSGISTNHLSLPSGTLRGNRTSECKWLNTTGGTFCTHTTYYDTGMPYQVTDPRGNVTTYSYSSTYAGAYVTQTTLPQTGSVQHIVSGTYDFDTGKLTSFTDQNNLVSNYQYDSLWRRTTASFPDGGQTTFSYPNNNTVQRQQTINSTLTKTTTTTYDGLARPNETQLNSDPQGTVYADTTYDADGRVYTVSNPYRQGTDPTTSSGITTYFYDALGRKCLEVPPDGTQPTGGVCPATQPANDLFTLYSGNTTTVTDQTGKSRESVTDGLGRLTQVFEDPGSSPHLNYETDYTYDALGDLLTVNQKGGSANSANWHTRTFSYDSLSRLLTSANPETATITYKYDADANCASPNSFPTLLVSKTDARGIRSCAQYDALNRETVLNYSNGDTTIATSYDQSACLTLSACQNIGQRTSMTDAAGSESWAYQVDATNHRSVHANQRTTNSITKNSTYYFDLAGNVTQAVYPTGRTVNYTYDAADRPSTAADGSNGITYANDFQTAPTGCLAGKVCYTPQGTFYALSIGQSSSFTGLNLTHTYNSRLQPNEFKASSTGGNVIDITYNFVDPVTTHNTGHVYGITNNLDSTRSQNFTYDQLNRITSALTTSTHATSPSHCWGEVYNPDPWGNLNSIAATTNSNYTGCSGESGFSTTADGNNHLPTFSYDASGNTQNDGAYTYAWDAESQLKSAAGITYAYDGDGRRVSKTNGTAWKLFWYGAGGEVLSETDGSGNLQHDYIFFGGKRVAMTDGGSPDYYVEDLLGTSRVMTYSNGALCYDADFYPYGGERAYTNLCTQEYKFEGKERDPETGNDDFGARYYSNRFGRWLSADWSSVPVPVPYANLTNPQTLNLYSMVADDPESFADLDGHQGGTSQECTTGQGSAATCGANNQANTGSGSVCNAAGTSCTTTTSHSEIIGVGGDTYVLRNWTTSTTTNTDSDGNVTSTVTTQTYTQARFSSETGKFIDATQTSQSTIKVANGQQYGVIDGGMIPRPISETAARAALGLAAFDNAQSSATPGGFKSYLLQHKSGMKGLLLDIALAFTPAPEVRWAAEAKEFFEKILFVHTVHELLP